MQILLIIKNSYKYQNKMTEQPVEVKQREINKKQSDKSLDNSSESSAKQKKQKKSQKVPQQSTQRNSSQRSRSRKKRRSRSKETKKKHKSKHKSNKRRSRSQSSESDRSRSHKRKRSRDRKKRQFDRGRDRGRYQQRNYNRDRNINMIPELTLPTNSTQMPMPLMPGERRKRQRSRSPLDYYRNHQNNNDGQFWDAFSWVPRINYTPNVSTSALANTKKMRRLMITKIPYQIGITQDNLRDLITRFMAQNYLKDQMNNCPVVNLQINQTDHNVAVELSSVEETCRVCRMEKIQLFKGLSNGIIRLGDSIYGNSLLTQAQTAGQAQAAAFAAMSVLQKKKTNFTIDSSTGSTSSTVIRVTNAVTPYITARLTPEQWEDYKEDLLEGFSQYGKIVHSWFVSEAEKNICADPGNLFIEYQYKQNAEAAMAEMQGRLYDQRTIKLFYWPRDLYYKNFRPDITPPTLPPPLKTTKQPAKQTK